MLFGNLQPRFQERESLANLAFSQVLLKKQDSGKKQQSMMFGQSMRGMTNIMTLEGVLTQQQTPAVEISLDINFSGLESIRRLTEQLGQEHEFVAFVEAERNERLLKLAKLGKRMKLEESLQRIVGFLVVQVQLGYNLPMLIGPESVRN